MNTAGLPEGLVEAVAAVWDIPRPRPDDLHQTESFERLRKLCAEAYGHAGDIALGGAIDIALSRYGFPCGLAEGDVELALSPDEAARRLDRAFRATDITNIHLCPLNGAGEIPLVTFGPNRVRKFTQNELEAIVEPTSLKRYNPRWEFDARRFSKFTWLVVKETVPVTEAPGQRAFPFPDWNTDDDFGRAVPHRARFPKSVENALFALLLAPWEEWTTFKEIDWRCFTVPWSYMIGGDDFVSPLAPPSPDTLSWDWTPASYDWSTRVATYEAVPEECPVETEISVLPTLVDDTHWDHVAKAVDSPLFETPIVHFLLKAFLDEGIDELLAHVTMIDAALGLKTDQRTMATLKRRMAALPRGPSSVADFKTIYDRRSEFLHGRAMEGDIPSADRIVARKLAHTIASALVEAAQGPLPSGTREGFLRALG